jgi:hypothetical protein
MHIYWTVLTNAVRITVQERGDLQSQPLSKSYRKKTRFFRKPGQNIRVQCGRSPCPTHRVIGSIASILPAISPASKNSIAALILTLLSRLENWSPVSRKNCGQARESWQSYNLNRLHKSDSPSQVCLDMGYLHLFGPARPQPRRQPTGLIYSSQYSLP